ncbi:hypothetical protein A9A89_0481 [Bifidobacterium psychraerophilum DSM 22366]|uniref:Uncharacterized protein n=1 Tax=Bifidobacterium psychraerophilum TaxID=218140 RepID=A0A087CIX2_9BIFI|nr:hypothetical protein BPSY_0315 [Bifidobacterium psychraerophilum]PKA94280.1 hypothetical protein A9A89_0481 [Bifidobacterium psychraerophilum DSM 22366]
MKTLLYAIVKVIYTPYRILCGILSIILTIGFFIVLLNKQNIFQNGKPWILVLIVGILVLLQLIRVLLVKLLAYLLNGDTVIVGV